jgi:hypothetical protein
MASVPEDFDLIQEIMSLRTFQPSMSSAEILQQLRSHNQWVVSDQRLTYTLENLDANIWFPIEPHHGTLPLDSGTTASRPSAQLPGLTVSATLALTNIGLPTRDLMAAINRMETKYEVDHSWVIQSLQTSSEQPGQSTGNVLQTFSLFGQLPSEIRVKIWAHACFHQRNIDIFTEILGEVRVNKQDTYRFESYKYLSQFCPHPAILHTCKESRDEGLKHYQLAFGTSHSFSIVNISTPPRIYVNFACDRLCLLEPECFGLDKEDRFRNFVSVCQKNGARSLALNVAGDQHWGYVGVATSWDALQEIILFGSSTEFEDVADKVAIDLIKFQDMTAYCSEEQKEEYLNEATIRHLEVARRDFYALFQMHENGLQSDFESSNGKVSAQRLWKPPAVELRHLLVQGKLDASDWAWGR